jgi:predicted transposase/invertase (TIGR01784 family)
MAEKYLDPKNDLLFKKIFGEHPELLLNFLNAIMPFEHGRYIKELHYLQAEQVPENPGKKNSIVDVKCVDNYKRQFIVEMQMFWNEAFYNRIVFNAGKAYVKQLNKAEEYHLLEPVYTLALLNENFDNKTDKCYHYYQIINKENTEEIIHGLEFILVELLKFRPQTWSDRKLAMLWLRFLNEVNEDTKEIPKELQSDANISQAIEMCKESALTDAEREAYDAYWDMIRVERTLREGSIQEGKKIGRAEGRAEGLAEGEQERLKLEKSIAEKDLSIAEKDQSLAEKDNRIAELERQLNKIQNG